MYDIKHLTSILKEALYIEGVLDTRDSDAHSSPVSGNLSLTRVAQDISRVLELPALKRETFRLFQFPSADRLKYPVLSAISKDFDIDMGSMSVSDLALVYGEGRKIEFIKAIRERFMDDKGKPMGLRESKVLAEGMFAMHKANGIIK